MSFSLFRSRRPMRPRVEDLSHHLMRDVGLDPTPMRPCIPHPSGWWMP